MAGEFKTEDYEDKYRIVFRKLIESRLGGQKIQAPPVSHPAGSDLMAALKAGIEAALKCAE